MHRNAGHEPDEHRPDAWTGGSCGDKHVHAGAGARDGHDQGFGFVHQAATAHGLDLVHGAADALAHIQQRRGGSGGRLGRRDQSIAAFNDVEQSGACVYAADVHR